jgi:hypothetical protein
MIAESDAIQVDHMAHDDAELEKIATELVIVST